jgi:hypothetical protein
MLGYKVFQNTAIISIILRFVHMKNSDASSSMKNLRNADIKVDAKIPFASLDTEIVEKSHGNAQKLIG